MKVAIMQPTFLPWLGYFHLASKVEKFVFLDSVQFDTRSWQQRNKILLNGKPFWVTIPTILTSGRSTKINEVLINKEHYSSDKIIKTIRQAYGKLPGNSFNEEVLFPHLAASHLLLSDMTIAIIKSIFEVLEIKATILKSSELTVSGTKAELLLSICSELGATSYFSPEGSRGYLAEFDGFDLKDISVEYQEFEHPTYKQSGVEFVPYLSVIDSISNLGIQGVKELIKFDIETR